MSGTRVMVDLFFKNKTPQQVNQDFPQLLPAIKVAKKKASKINEENTVRATYHICHHDEPGNNIPCEEIEI